MNKDSGFSGLRKYFWPVYADETKKVFPLALLMFFILFNYTILRDIKDCFILTAYSCGAETLTFLKLWGTLPFAILLMTLYAKLSIHMSKQNIFFIVIGLFFAFFVLFGYVIFPNTNYLHASNEFIDGVVCNYPRLRHVLPLFFHWGYSLFYIFSELWGSIGLSVLFWQFANDITNSQQAKRLYPLFGLLSNFGVILAGKWLVFITDISKDFEENERWAKVLDLTTWALIVGFIIITLSYVWIQKNVVNNLELDKLKNNVKKKQKPKLTLQESLKLVCKSKYIALIAILVLAYGITVNFVEVTLKSQLQLLYSNKNDMIRFYGNVSTFVGVFTIMLMIIGSNITRIYKWIVGAILTPAIMLFAGCAFFVIVIFKESISDILNVDKVLMLKLSVYIGFALLIVIKSAKYSLFDPSKERAYIPLEDNLKVQGKAAVDGIGGRLGKSGGAIIQQVLLIIMNASQITIAPILSVLLIFFCASWLYSVLSLSKMFESKIRETSQ